MSTFGSFEIGRRALHTQQKGAEVSGQNIANANTEGYTRQTVQKNALRPPAVPGVETPPGYGVEVSDIDRVRSEFYDNQIRDSLTSKNYWEKKNETYSAVESIFQEPGDLGINDAMGKFFDAWQELSVNPESHAARASLVEQAESFTRLVQDTYDRLDNLQDDIKKELEDVKVDDVNSMLNDIAEMNDSIAYLDAMGQKSNELLDERDLRLEQLSEMIDFEVEETDRGVLNVKVNVEDNNGIETVYLVEGDELKREIKVDNDNDVLSLMAENVDDGEQEDIILNSGDGALKGLLESYNEDIPEYKQDLDKMVFNFVKEVNMQHRMGQGLDGEINNAFFEDFENVEDFDIFDFDKIDGIENIEDIDDTEGIDDVAEFIGEVEFAYNGNDYGYEEIAGVSQEFNVSDIIKDDLDKVAAASINGEEENGEEDGEEKAVSGDGRNALKIAQLREESVMGAENNEGTTFQEYFRSMIADLGVKGRESERMFESMSDVTDNLVERRDSVSSVSTDDEMLDMLQYQHAYNAAAKFMNTFDEMLTVLMSEL